MAAIFSYVQDQVAIGDPASATFGATPTQGNLLIAVGQERSGGAAANFTISGSGWTKIISRTIQQGDTTFRRTLVVWIKVAGASEPTNIQIDDGATGNKYLTIFELGTDTPVTWAVETSVSNDNSNTSNATSIGTGTTGSAPSGNLLLIGVAGLKYGSSGGGGSPPASFASETLTVDAWHSASGFTMWDAIGWVQIDPGSGTYSSTATWASSPSNSGLSAALIVVSGTEGGGGTEYTQSTSGSITATGVIIRQTNARRVGSITTTGLINRFTSVRRLGSLTVTGLVRKLTSVSKSGSVTSTGVVRKTTNKTFLGSSTISGAISRQINVLRTGVITVTGVISKLTSRLLTGSSTVSGLLLGGGSIFSQGIAGSITPSGVLNKAVTFVRNYASSITLSGSLGRVISITLRGNLSLTGSLLKTTFKAFSGAITSVGSLSAFKFTPSGPTGIIPTMIRTFRKYLGRR